MILCASFADQSVFVHRVLLGASIKPFMRLYCPITPCFCGVFFFYDTTVDCHYINEKYGRTPRLHILLLLPTIWSGRFLGFANKLEQLIYITIC